VTRNHHNTRMYQFSAILIGEDSQVE
jgi:hypothetical protein